MGRGFNFEVLDLLVKHLSGFNILPFMLVSLVLSLSRGSEVLVGGVSVLSGVGSLNPSLDSTQSLQLSGGLFPLGSTTGSNGNIAIVGPPS